MAAPSRRPSSVTAPSRFQSWSAATPYRPTAGDDNRAAVETFADSAGVLYWPRAVSAWLRQLPLFASNMVAKGRPSKADSTWKILASLEVVPSLRQKPPPSCDRLTGHRGVASLLTAPHRLRNQRTEPPLTRAAGEPGPATLG